MRPWLLLALACALAPPGPATARAYTVDDLLSLERLGPVQLAPGGRWGVVQTFRPWDQAPRYDLDWWSTYGLGRLRRVDLRTGDVRPLLPHQLGSGYLAGPFSPSGAKMAVSRLCGQTLELGVATLASGEVVWLGLSPELWLWGRSVAWRTDDELVVIAQPEQPVGHLLGYGWQAQARLTKAWADAAAGRLAVNAVGSGRYRNIRPKGPPKHLVTVRVSDGMVRTLASGEFIDLEVAPDGRTVAALANGDDVQAPDEPPTTGTLPRRRTLTLIDLGSGEISHPCADCDVTPRLLTWSASGDRLLLHTGDRDGVDGGYRIVNARTGTLAPAPLGDVVPALSRARDNAGLPAAAWLGETPVVYARPAGPVTARADWYGLEAAGPRNLTSALSAPSPRLLAVDAASLTVADGEAVWQVPINGQAYRLPVRPADILPADSVPESERLAVRPPSSEGLAVRSPDGLKPLLDPKAGGLPLRSGEHLLAAAPRAAAIVSKTDRRGVERVLLRTDQGKQRELVVLNAGLAQVDPAEIRPIHHLGADGRAVTSWLYLPSNMAAEKRAPLVVVPYPGDELTEPPQHQTPGTLTLYTNAQVLAGQGYAVLIPSLPTASDREPMGGLAEQVLAAVNAAAAQAPVDAERLAVWGHSYGGYTALALATQSPRFKAVIASAAPSDLTSLYGRLSAYSYAVPEAGLPIFSAAGWSETGQGRMGSPPWKDPERYRRNSPVSFADRITAPVMLIHGDMDLDIGQPQEMFTRLYRQNKDAVLIIYRGESHVILGPANVRDQYERVLAFLAEHVGPDIAP